MYKIYTNTLCGIQRRITKFLLIMKLTIIILIMSLMQVSAVTSAQRLTLKQNEVSLKRIFREINKQTGYDVVYQPILLNPGKKINADFNNATLDEVLKACLQGQALTYIVYEKTIVIKQGKPEPKVAPVVIPPLRLITISGTVTDTTGAPLPGATIKVKGGNQSTSADASGKFTLKNVEENAILQISFIGYATREVKATSAAGLIIKLKTQNAGISEVVVVGYNSQSKARITGAVSTVKMAEVLGDRPVSTTSDLMIGVVPGLQVSIPSGQPGSSTSFNLRGGTDLNTSGSTINEGSPLILVDNVPFNGPLNLLDPNDIETLTVLKDAGSAAIYGGRSAFGVVLITTKSGRKNQNVQFQYNNNIAFASATNLPVVANATQFLQSLQDMGTTSYWSGQNVATWQQLEKNYIADPSQYPGGIVVQGNIPYQLAPSDQIKNLLGSSVPQFQNNFSVSGGSDKTTFRLSLGSVDQNGIIVPSAHQDNFMRYTVSSVVSTDVNKWLTAQLSANYYNSKTTTPSNNEFSAAVFAPPLIPDTYTLSPSGVAPGINALPSTLVATGTPDISQTSDTRLTGRVILTPITGLKVTGEYTFDDLQNNQTNYNIQNLYITPYNFQPSLTGSGVYELYSSPTTYKSLNIFGEYVKSFGDHNFDLLAGYNQEENVFSYTDIYRNGMIAPNLPSITNATGPLNGSNNYGAYSLLGYFGRLTYDYKGKYLAQIGGRYDGSSRFPANHRFGFFPSGSVGWRVIDEEFMKNLKPVLSELKLRASYGSVGNQNIPDLYIPKLNLYIPNAYPSFAVLNGTQPQWLNGTGSYLTSLSSPGLISSNFTWETVQTLDYGTDFGFFSNHLTGSFDWYKRNTNNILATGAIPLPAVLGTGAPLQNTASLTAKGYEIQLNWNDKIGQVKYHIGVNVYDSQSTVTRFEGNPTDVLSTYYVGQKMGAIWGYVTNGFYTPADFVPGSLSSNLTGGKLLPGVAAYQGELPNPGDIKYKDLNGDGVISPGAGTLSNPGDKKIIGNSTPRYQFGLNGNVAYKNFDFSFVLSGVGKQDLFVNNILTFPNYNPFAPIYASELNYWTPTNTNAHFGRIYDQAAGNQSFNEITQTRFLLNGAYLRVNNLTLAYTLPAALVKKIHLHSLRVFGGVENPFLFDHLPKGLDPSLADQGSGLQYPFLRQTNIGVNLTF